MASTDIERLQDKAGDAARLLALIANEKRLLMLCRLVSGEAVVGELVDLTGLAGSAVSQHLAKLKAEGIVTSRKAGLNVYYRLADDRAARVISVLKDIYCPDPE
jgi:DNA-binding transcriptional ArsR family regulator